MGKYFSSEDELYKVFRAFLQAMTEDPKISPALAKANMIVRFGYTDPEAWITIHMGDPDAPNGTSFECTDDKPVEEHKKPDVTMVQSADFSHSFWHGKENAAMAIFKRKIKATGDQVKALKLLPVIKPSFKMYPEVLKELGFEDKVLK